MAATREPSNERRALRIRRVPSLFVAHGSPLAVVDKDYAAALGRFGSRQRHLRAIVVVSAHWQTRGVVQVTSSATPKLIYDFMGFPSWLYEIQYPCPGDRLLAQAIAFKLQQAGVDARLDPERGLDHGVWVPLSVAFPDARIPVIQVSLPVPAPPDVLASIGRALAPLRHDNVLLIGSGGLVHNLGLVRMDVDDTLADPWAESFDTWARERAGVMDASGLAAYASLGPNAKLAVPTSEHYDPILFVMGTALPGDTVLDVYDGFRYGSLSMRTLALVGRRREDKGY